MRTRRAIVGIVSVLAALGVAEVLAAFADGVPAPMDAVGQALIPRFPGAVTSLAIAVFGAANRAVLLGGILVVSLAIGALVGLATRRWVAVAAFGAAAAIGLSSSIGQPGARPIPAAVVMLATAVVGVVVLRWLQRTVPDPVPRAAVDGADDRLDEPRPPDDPRDPPVQRRAFLTATVAVGATAAGAVMLSRTTLVAPSTSPPPTAGLPAPARRRPAVVAANRAPVAGVSELLTPNDAFYRIDTALRVPRVDPATWRLRVHGLVDRELVIDYDQLLERDLVEADVTLACVSNEVGGDLIGTARWLGVRLDEVLAEAGVQAGATQLVGRSIDGWTGGFPTELATDGRDALIAVGMNGEALPERHGFPARLVVPGLFGYVSATKWLTELELTTWEAFDGYWVPRGWSKRGPIKTSSRIDVPRRNDVVDAGAVVVAGVAWAPTRGVTAVEVRVDEGEWSSATLARPLDDATWVPWWLEVQLPAGEHDLVVRAVDGAGDVQPQGPRSPAPDGAEGWHRIRVRAT